MISPPRNAQDREAGQAILITAMVLFLLMLALALVDEALIARLRAIRDESRRVEIDALADAAMAEALANLAANPAYPGAAPHGLARGEISSRIVKLDLTRYEVTAEARFAGDRRALRAEVDLPWGRPIVASWRSLR